MADSNKPLGGEHDDIRLPRRPYWKYTLAAAGVTAAMSWIALMATDPAGSNDPAHVLQPAQPPAAPAPAQGSTPAAPVRRGQPANARPPAPPSAATTQQPARDDAQDLRALASDNPGDRIEALRSIRDRNAVALLPELLERDPANDPDAAPTLIAVSADLGQRADLHQRTAVAAKLGQWLRDEGKRTETDARANVSVLVGALGRLETPESVRALIEALDSDQLPVHVATLAARGLEKLGDPTARAAVERFRARVAGAPAADSFQRELNAEALAAADSALSRWSH